jgi:hypothetical protein
VADPGSLWPGGTVYYQIVNGSGDQGNIGTAITTFNNDFSGVVQWVNGTGSGTYVSIYLDPNDTNGSCDVNSIGYPPYPNTVVTMGGSGTCTISTILHEMGHIVGLYHEFTRTDRDSYVTVNYNNVIKGSYPSDFAINTQNQQLLTPYDYASVMQYPSFVLSRNGGPVIETIPAGIPLQGTEGVAGAGTQDYSAGDKEAIMRLYGHAPTTVTVTSNPVGLQVIVDGTTYTTPQTFTTWTLNSSHTLSVPSGVQTISGDIENSSTTATFYYTYGRWNDSTAQTHTITLSPGDGSPAFPTSSPAVTTYSANFIELVPYTETVSPSASGTVSVSPLPQTYSGATGSFFVARQKEVLTASPASGYNFYEFTTPYPYYFLPGGISANPKTFYVPDTGNPVNVLAEFTTYPVFTFNVVPSNPIPNDFTANLGAYIDSAFWNTPKSFSADPALDGSAWNFSTSHTLSIPSPDSPYSVNTEYLFSSWSDGGAQSHSISAPGSSTAYTATVIPQYQPATNFSYACGGTATITPASTESGFYPSGTQLTYTATPTSGWTFAGWSYDLSGTANPTTLTATDESLVFANFNITNTPLTLTGLSPSSVAAGSSAFTLTLIGTGFSSGSYVVVNGNYFTGSQVTFVSSTQLQVSVPSSLVTTAGTFDVYVENFPAGSNGCAVFAYDTFAVTAAGSGTTTPTINWTPTAEIVNGDAGAGVLNAATSPEVIGNFTYSATPSGGGTAVNVTGGTSGLTPGKYTITASFSPINPMYAPATVNKSLTVAGETVWIVNSGGSLSELTGDGTAVSSSAFTGGSFGIGIDATGNLWSGGPSYLQLNEENQVGTQLSPVLPYGGLGTPAGVAIDGNSQIWVTNANSTVSLFANNGTALSPSSGFTDTSLSTPTGIAIDLGGSVWIANKGNNSVTRILGAAAPAAPLATAAANNTTGAKP